MTPAILLLGFGEPESATHEVVAPFLERIFLANARLSPGSDPDEVRRRARSLAAARVEELVGEYRRIGGSPLNGQAARQAERLESALRERGHPALVLTGMQFTDPGIGAAVERTRDAGVDRLIVLPLYPLCGPSTTVAALATLRGELDRSGWSVPVDEVTGWHAHPSYTALVASGVRDFCARQGVRLADPGTRLVFSAHGTPIQYLEEGSRYDLYVEDHCRRVADALGVDRYVIGYQNHTNRPDVAWTQPDIDRAIHGVDARRIVVVPVSFLQELSETLAELDVGLRSTASELGFGFHRVPVPHDDPRLVALLADLVTPFLAGSDPGNAGYRSCRCRTSPDAVCLTRELARPGR